MTGLSDFWDFAERYKFVIGIGAFFAALGWFLTSPHLVQWLNGQMPITILVFWYAVVFGPLIFIFGRAHHGDEAKAHRHALAAVMFYFGFSLATSTGSAYISNVTGTDASPILESSEAGVAFDFMTSLGLTADTARLATYVVLPFLMIIGAAVVYKPEFIMEQLKRK